jgi:hypothetical protein
MTLAGSILAIAVFLLCATVGALALVVAGIRKSDRRGDLTGKPPTRVEAIARCLLLGVSVPTSERKDSERS